MQFDDPENDAGTLTGAARDNPAADFGRRRVSRILNRERPLCEQHDRTTFDVWEVVWQIMKKDKHACLSGWRFGTRLDADVFCKWGRTHVRASKQTVLCLMMRKRLANLNSRFLGRPG